MFTQPIADNFTQWFSLTQDITKIKDQLWRKYRVRLCEDNFNKHPQFSNKLSKEICRKRKEYENSLIGSGVKAVFKYTRNQLLTAVPTPLLGKLEGTLCTTSTEVVEQLANSFETVYIRESLGSLSFIKWSKICQFLLRKHQFKFLKVAFFFHIGSACRRLDLNR